MLTDSLTTTPAWVHHKAQRGEALLAALVLAVVGGCDGCGGETGDGNVNTLVPALTTSTNALAFGEAYVGDTRRLTLQLTSTGTAEVNFGEITIAPADGPFAILSPSLTTLAPTEIAVVEILFAPAFPVASAATLSISNDVTDGAVIEVALSAAGLAIPDCDDGNQCTNNIFDISAEECVTIQLDTSCDDGNACTENDRCAQGVCIGVALACVDDDNACTIGYCDPLLGCMLAPEDALCDDDNPCTDDRCSVTDGCQHSLRPEYSLCGPFVQCQDASVCIEGICTAHAVEDGTPCNDENACTTEDVCVDGACGGARVQRPPELISEVTVVNDRIDLDPYFSTANLQLNATQFLIPGDHLHLVELEPSEQDPTKDTLRLVTSNPWFERLEFVHVFNQSNVVMFEDKQNVLSLYDYSIPQSPVLIEILLGDIDNVHVAGSRVAVCDDDDALTVYTMDPVSGFTPELFYVDPDFDCDDDEFAATGTHAADASGETEVAFIRFDPDNTVTSLGSLALPPSPDDNRTANVDAIALNPTSFVVLRSLSAGFSSNQPNQYELLFGDIPTAPLVDGGDFGATGTTVSLDAYSGYIELVGMVGDAARIIVNDQFVELLKTGEVVTVIAVPDDTRPFAAAGNIVLSDHATQNLTVTRIVGNTLRENDAVAMPTFNRLRLSGDDLFLLAERGFARTTIDAAAAGEPMALLRPSGLRGSLRSLLTYPGGLDWLGPPVVDDSLFGFDLPSDALDFDRVQIDANGAVDRSFPESVSLFEAFDVTDIPNWKFESSSIDVEGCQGAMSLAFKNLEDEDEHLYLGLINVCGPSTFTPYYFVEVNPSFYNTVPIEHSRRNPTLKFHGDGVCSLTHRGRTLLFDLSLPTPATVLADVYHVPSGDNEDTWTFVDVNYHQGKLVIARSRPRTEGGADEVVVVDVENGATESVYQIPRWDLSGIAPLVRTEVPILRVLAVDFPRAFIRSSRIVDGRPQFVVEILNLAQPIPTLDAAVAVSGRPVDAKIVGDKLFVATETGLATISPPCGPTD